MDFLIFLDKYSGALVALSSLLLAIITLIYVILTSKLVLENKRMREAQTEPKISVTIQPHEENISLVDLVVYNIGLGPAFDIRLKTTPDFMCHTGKKHLSEYNFVKYGLKYLAPKEEFRHFLNFLRDMTEEEMNTIYKGLVTYKNAIGKQFEDDFIIDLSVRLDLLLPEKENKITENLEKIQKDIHSLVDRFK